MKLKPTMFFDPEPELKDFKNTVMLGSDFPSWEDDIEGHNKVLTEWKRRQEKPEPKEWIKFAEKEPEFNQKVYISSSKQMHPYPMKYGREIIWSQAVKWVDGKEYDKALQYYEENRLRYEGFERIWFGGHKYPGDNFTEYVNEKAKVIMEESGHTTIYCNDIEICTFYDSITVSLFEQICSENGIELKQI